MKRLLSVLFIILFILTACGQGQNQTEEERKAQIREQIKAEEALKETLKQEIIEEMKAENKEIDNVSVSDMKDQPTHYYQEKLHELCLSEYGADAKEAMDNPAYQSSMEFKNAVDAIYERGYRLISENGYYRIVNPNVVNIKEMITVNEMCKLLDISLEDLEQAEDGGYFIYWTSFKNDEISFSIGHDEPLKGDEYLLDIRVMGYGFSILGISLGQSVKDAYAMIDKTYDGYEDRHSNTIAKYVYNVDDYAFKLNDYGWDNQQELSETEIINQIDYYGLLD